MQICINKFLCTVCLMHMLALPLAGCGDHRIRTDVYKSTDLSGMGKKATTPEELVEKSINEGNLEELTRLIKNGFLIDTKLESGRTPLQHAIFIEKFNAIRFLISRRADPLALDKNGQNAYWYAEKSGSKERILLILDPTRMADLQKQVHQSVRDNNYQHVQELLKAGTDPNFIGEDGQTPLTLAVSLAVNSATPRKYVALIRTFLDPAPAELDLDVSLPNSEGHTAISIAEAKAAEKPDDRVLSDIVNRIKKRIERSNNSNNFKRGTE